MKSETGQADFTTPEMIIENGDQITAPAKIASALNRQYLQKIRKLVNDLPPPSIDPMDHYTKTIGENKSSFTFEQINMNELPSKNQRS